MSYTSFELSFIYVNYSFESLLNYTVSSQIFDVLSKITEGNELLNGINRPRRRSLNYFNIMQKSHFDSIIYSALSIESFINKLGFCIYNTDYSTNRKYDGKALERCNLDTKVKNILENLKGNSLDMKREEYSMVKDLFKNRDELVHDKPEVIDGFILGLKKAKNIAPITPENAFSSLLFIDKIFSEYKYKNTYIKFVSDIVEHNHILLTNKCVISVDCVLPFSEAKFTDINLYRYYMRNTLGYEIPVEISNNIIIPRKV